MCLDWNFNISQSRQSFMEFIILKEKLKNALNIAERVGGKKSGLNILDKFLLRTIDKKQIEIKATDLDIGYTAYLPAQIEKEGEIALPIKIVNDFVSKFQEETIRFKVKENNLEIIGKNSYSLIPGTTTEDFPIIPKTERKNKITIKFKDFQDSIERILPVLKSSELKPELNGVYFYLNGGYLKIVTTDSFRLAEKTINSFKSSEKDLNLYIPKRIIQEVNNLDCSPESDLNIWYDENQVEFEIENNFLISRLINLEYPKYQEIIPKDFKVEIILSYKELFEALNLSKVFASRINEVIFEFDGKLTCLAKNELIGENKVILEPKTIKKEVKNFKIAFNIDFFVDGLKAVEDDEIYIGFNDSEKPSLIKNPKDESFFYILMPVYV